MATSRGVLQSRGFGSMKCFALALMLAALAGCAHSPGSSGAAYPVAAAAEPPPPPPPPPPDDEMRALAEAQARAEAERAQRQARASREAEMQARAMAEREASRYAAEAPLPDRAAPRAGSVDSAASASPVATAPDNTPVQATDALPDETSEVDALLARLRVGNIAFNAPQTINIRDTVRVRALVSPDENVATLQAQIDAPGEPVVAPLKVSKLMEARLTGEGFRIVPISSAQQAVGSGVTTWEWEVTPETEGRHRLTLTVDAFVRMDGQSVAKTLRTFDHPIDVQVTASQRVGGWAREHGKWAWSTLLVPLWAWWTRRRKSKAESGTN